MWNIGLLGWIDVETYIENESIKWFNAGRLKEKKETVINYILDELKSTTRNFRPNTVLGECGFGRVFKGWIDENTFKPSRVGVGIPVAVKNLSLIAFRVYKNGMYVPFWFLKIPIIMISFHYLMIPQNL